MSDRGDASGGSPVGRISLIGFDDDPFADPYLADIAARHGFTPSMVTWEDFDKARGGGVGDTTMPIFTYRAVHYIAHVRYEANLVVYHDEFNYGRNGDVLSLHVHTLLPDSVIAAMMGRPLSDVIDHPSLRSRIITRIDVDEQRERTTFRSDVSASPPQSD